MANQNSQMMYYGEVSATCKSCGDVTARSVFSSPEREYVQQQIETVKKQFRKEFPKTQLAAIFEGGPDLHKSTCVK